MVAAAALSVIYGLGVMLCIGAYRWRPNGGQDLPTWTNTLGTVLQWPRFIWWIMCAVLGIGAYRDA